jgi:hypothetical protein
VSSIEIAVVAAEEDQIVEEVNATVAQAHALTVATPDQAQAAVEFLSRIAGAKKRSEKARKVLVDPLNAHVKMINERLKGDAAPLDEADNLVRGKLLAFQQEEQRRVAAEQARIDAERRAAEERAEAERRRQADEAAQAEREAAERERARQAELRKAENERAREIAMLDDYELEQLYQAGTDRELVDAEQASRRAAREAQERADTTRREAEEAQQREIAVASVPAVAVTTTRLASESGSASVRKVWRAYIEDESAIPREYLQVDVKKINAAVKDGVREIPGVRVAHVDEMSVRAR